MANLFGLEHQKLHQIDEIFCNIKVNIERYLAPTHGFSLKTEGQEDIEGSFVSYAVFLTETEEDILKTCEINSPPLKVNKLDTHTPKDDTSTIESNSFSAYHKSSILRDQKSFVLKPIKITKRQKKKRSFFDLFNGLKRFCCLKC